jgi:hypothetical protein
VYRAKQRRHRRCRVECLEPRWLLSGAPDSFEPDNDWTQARLLPLDGTVQQRSIHEPKDVDWATFSLSEVSTPTWGITHVQVICWQ